MIHTGAAGAADSIFTPLGADDFLPHKKARAELGQLLFYDPILSGNQNISCGTCHHHDLASADALPLGIGEGGSGIGTKRTAGIGDDRIAKRIPRNAPALFNLGAREITHLFHDGRLSHSDDYDNGFDSPAEEWLPDGLPSLLAAQALFPLTSEFEMAGNPGENQVAGAAYDRIDYVWPIISDRVRSIPQYKAAFIKQFDDIETALDISITHIAIALADFINFEWQSFDSPWDEYLATDQPMPDDAMQGLALFTGKANCSSCHSGPLFTDHDFHALALPQFGPGRTRRFDPYARDTGRMAETDDLADAYRFRTPSLRNVALTAPYGHNGAYATLEGIIRHHLNPLRELDRWQPAQVDLPAAPWLSKVDFITRQDTREQARLRHHVDIKPVDLSDAEVQQLVAFLHTLTGTNSRYGKMGPPGSVPSGLPID
jgi:cytochrome c peroxidase